MEPYIIYKGQLFVRKQSPNDGFIVRALLDTTVTDASPYFKAEVVSVISEDCRMYKIGEKCEFTASRFVLMEELINDNGTKLNIEGKASNTQIGGDHYASMAIQPVEFIAKNNLDYFQGNVIKYVCRHASKNGKEDLLKAKHYIDLLIEQKYK